MIENDREILVGENRFYLGEDNILYVTLVGEVDDKTAITLNNTYFKFMAMVEGKLNCIVDINKAGQQSSQIRKKGKEILEDERIGKVGLFGLHPVARVIASFVIGVTKKSDMRFFKTKEDALTWLKE